MAKTNAQRQQERWDRMRAAMVERDQLRGQVEALEAETERLKAELEAERSGRHSCRRHGVELACYLCRREQGEGWDTP